MTDHATHKTAEATGGRWGALSRKPQEAAAPCPACRYYTGHTSWCPLRPAD